MDPRGGNLSRRGKAQKRKVQRKGRAQRKGKVWINHHNPENPCLCRLTRALPPPRLPIRFSKRRMKWRVCPDQIYRSRLVLRANGHRPECQSRVSHRSCRLLNLPPRRFQSHFKPFRLSIARISPTCRVVQFHHLGRRLLILKLLPLHPALDLNQSCWLDVDPLVHLDQDYQCCLNYAKTGIDPIQPV